MRAQMIHNEVAHVLYALRHSFPASLVIPNLLHSTPTGDPTGDASTLFNTQLAIPWQFYIVALPVILS